MSNKTMAEYYQFKLQSKEQRIPSTDIFYIDDENDSFLFNDGSILNIESKPNVDFIPKCDVELSYNKSNEGLFTCLKFERLQTNKSQEPIDEMFARKLYLNFESDLFYTKTFENEAETLSKNEVVGFLDNIGLDIKLLEKSFNNEMKKNKELANIIKGCMSKTKNNVVSISKERTKRQKNKKRP